MTTYTLLKRDEAVSAADSHRAIAFSISGIRYIMQSYLRPQNNTSPIEWELFYKIFVEEDDTMISRGVLRNKAEVRIRDPSRGNSFYVIAVYSLVKRIDLLTEDRFSLLLAVR